MILPLKFEVVELTPADILSFLYTIGYFSVLGIAFFQPFPESNGDVLKVLLGILSTIMVTIVGVYFKRDLVSNTIDSTMKAVGATVPANDRLTDNEKAILR